MKHGVRGEGRGRGLGSHLCASLDSFVCPAGRPADSIRGQPSPPEPLSPLLLLEQIRCETRERVRERKEGRRGGGKGERTYDPGHIGRLLVLAAMGGCARAGDERASERRKERVRKGQRASERAGDGGRGRERTAGKGRTGVAPSLRTRAPARTKRRKETSEPLSPPPFTLPPIERGKEGRPSPPPPPHHPTSCVACSIPLANEGPAGFDRAWVGAARPRPAGWTDGRTDRAPFPRSTEGDLLSR